MRQKLPSRAIGYDDVGHPYVVYRAVLSDGSYLDIDARLADLSGQPASFCKVEIVNAEISAAIGAAALVAELRRLRTDRN